MIYLHRFYCNNYTLGQKSEHEPESRIGSIGRHTQIAPRRERYAADLRSIGQAGTLELLSEKSPHKDPEPFFNSIIVKFSVKGSLCKTEYLFGRKCTAHEVVKEEIVKLIRSDDILCFLRNFAVGRREKLG